MSQGVTFAASLGQGADLYSTLQRLALVRAAEEQNARDEAARRAMEQQRIDISQTAQGRLAEADAFNRSRLEAADARDQQERAAMAGLAGTLGFGSPPVDPNLVGPPAPPAYDFGQLDPVLQRQLVMEKMRQERAKIQEDVAEVKTQAELERLERDFQTLHNQKLAFEEKLRKLDPNDVTAAGVQSEYQAIQGDLDNVLRQIEVVRVAKWSRQYGVSPESTRLLTRPTNLSPERRAAERNDIASYRVEVDYYDDAIRHATADKSFDPALDTVLDINGDPITLAQARENKAAATRRLVARQRADGSVEPDSLSRQTIEGQSEALSSAAAKTRKTAQMTEEQALAQAKKQLQAAGRWPVSARELADTAKQLMNQEAE